MVKRRIRVVIYKRGNGLNAGVLSPNLESSFEEVRGGGVGVKGVVVGMALSVGPAGVGDKNREGFLNAERPKKIKFPLITANAVLTGVGRATDKAVIGVGVRGKGVYVVKVLRLMRNDLTVNGGGG